MRPTNPPRSSCTKELPLTTNSISMTTAAIVAAPIAGRISVGQDRGEADASAVQCQRRQWKRDKHRYQTVCNGRTANGIQMSSDPQRRN
jgi:hypothetical protein